MHALNLNATTLHEYYVTAMIVVPEHLKLDVHQSQSTLKAKSTFI